MTAQYTITYNQLTNELKRYCEDDTEEYVSDLDRIISRAQDRVCVDLDLDIFKTVTEGQATAAAGSTYTYDALKVLWIFFTASKTFAERRTTELVKMLGGTGLPRYFADQDETTLIWGPVPDAIYSFDIALLRRPAAINATDTENWLTKNAGDLLIKAALIESEMYLIAPERVTEFKQDYIDILAGRRHELRALGRSDYMEPMAAPVAQGG